MTTPSLPRSAGVLLHPTSLPGPFGIGDLGPVAFRWVETLAAMRQSWWQILPLGPTGAGDSPYQSFSAFAGNINLLSPEVIVLGGGVAGALGESFVERVWEIASRYTLPGATNGVRLVPAALEDDSGIIGAAALAKARIGGE